MSGHFGRHLREASLFRVFQRRLTLEVGSEGRDGHQCLCYIYMSLGMTGFPCIFILEGKNLCYHTQGNFYWDKHSASSLYPSKKGGCTSSHCNLSLENFTCKSFPWKISHVFTGEISNLSATWAVLRNILKISPLDQSLQTFLEKGQIVNILGIASYPVFTATLLNSANVAGSSHR